MILDGSRSGILLYLAFCGTRDLMMAFTTSIAMKLEMRLYFQPRPLSLLMARSEANHQHQRSMGGLGLDSDLIFTLLSG